jgi:hypothetical protein
MIRKSAKRLSEEIMLNEIIQSVMREAIAL